MSDQVLLRRSDLGRQLLNLRGDRNGFGLKALDPFRRMLLAHHHHVQLSLNTHHRRDGDDRADSKRHSDQKDKKWILHTDTPA